MPCVQPPKGSVVNDSKCKEETSRKERKDELFSGAFGVVSDLGAGFLVIRQSGDSGRIELGDDGRYQLYRMIVIVTMNN